MDGLNFKLPKMNLNALLVMAALGLIVGVGVYQAQVKGLLFQKLPTSSPQTKIEERRTVVEEDNAVTDVVEKSSDSVVAISASRRVFNPFDPFSSPRREDSTIGTGFVVSDKGVIVTNKHVVSETGSKYQIVTKDGQKFDVQRIYRDPTLDLAIIQTNAADLKPLDLGDSSKLKVGQTVIAIGNALGRFTNTVTKGIVSGLGRRVVAGDPFSGSAESLDNLIQTDAAINPGNSGGPLLNLAGEVIGVNVATTEGAQNIGFTIPINTVKPIVGEFLTTGTVSKPFLGIKYKFLSRDEAMLYEVPRGAYISEVIDDSPAQKAGVEAGDIITKINGQSVDSEGKISEVVSKSKIGDKLELDIWRDGKTLKVTATLKQFSGE